MSLISNAAAAAASPTLNLITHGHKKGGHAVKEDAASSSTQGPATTQSVLGSLFDSIEQIIGISVTAAPRAASGAAASAAAVTGAAGVTGGAAALASAAAATPSAAANVSPTFGGLGARIDTKA